MIYGTHSVSKRFDYLVFIDFAHYITMQLVMPFRIFNNLEAVVHYCSTIQKLTYLYTFSPSLHSSSVKCSDEGKDVSVFLSDYKIFSPLYKVYIHTIFLHTFGNSINDFYQVKRWVKRKKESAILKIVLCNQILNNPFSLLYSTQVHTYSLPNFAFSLLQFSLSFVHSRNIFFQKVCDPS